jgi:trans-aconitate 2-methyltransferase
MAADWDPGQYERFKAQRAQPFWDLVGLIEPGIGSAVDLGCGTGELTAALADRLGVGRMLGVDNSPNMLESARPHANDRVRFESGDIATWSAPADHDLVFANAAMHWVPDHPAVLARWIAALRPAGQLAVQVPANSDHESHRASVAVARREPFLSAMDGDPPADPVEVNVLAPERYSEVLVGLGVREPHVRLQVYPHEMPSSPSVVEWTKGTSLTRFFKRLPDDLHEPFVDAYRDELIRRIGDHEPYLFTFKRILMWGRLTGS